MSRRAGQRKLTRRLVALMLFLVAAVAGAFAWVDRPSPDLEARLARIAAAQPGDAARGAYVLRMAGCVACHTRRGGPSLAGGRALETPFGRFFTPNITPDPETGIGGWSTRDLAVALLAGRMPDGRHYYPAFPYTSYAAMNEQDLADLKAYLDSVTARRNPVPDHELAFPFNLRPALALWKLLFFRPIPFRPDPTRTAAWNRGAYLVTGPGHCQECHRPRNALGGFAAAHLAGAVQAGKTGRVANITPDARSGIGDWSLEDIAFALETGITPEGDTLGGTMAEVVKEGTSHLTVADLEAIATYLQSLPPVAVPPAVAQPQ